MSIKKVRQIPHIVGIGFMRYSQRVAAYAPFVALSQALQVKDPRFLKSRDFITGGSTSLCKLKNEFGVCHHRSS